MRRSPSAHDQKPSLWVHLVALAGFVYVAARMLIAPQTAITFDRATRRIVVARRGLTMAMR